MSAIQTPITIDGLTQINTSFVVVPTDSHASGLMIQNLEATSNLYLSTDAASAHRFVKIAPSAYWEFPVLLRISGLISPVWGAFDGTPALAVSAYVTVIQ